MERVLIVDDNPADLRLAVALLREDFECLTASDGREALETLKREPAHLVLSDILMPGMDGFTLCARAHAELPSGECPRFLLVTALDEDPETHARAQQCGAQGCLSKPFEAKRLLEALRGALAGPARPAPAAPPSSLSLREYSEWLVRHLKESVAALKESEERHRLIFEACRDGLILLDSPARHILKANRRAQELFGFPAPGLERKALAELAAPGQGPPEEGRDVVFLRADGSSFLGEIRFSIFEWRGRPRTLAVVRDVSQERRLQEELLQSEKLASIGLLLSGVAHELNNPLTAVLGHAQLILMDTTPGTQVHEDVSVIQREANRCKRLILSLLSFARKHEHLLAPADLNALLSEVLDLKAYDFRRAGISLNLDLAKDLPHVLVDTHQMQQVVLNLLNNAEQAMGAKRGSVAIETRAEGGSILLAVADTGPGIAPEHLPRIFEPFFTTKEPGKGTGLGLSICRNIVQEHGGEITLESRPGEGARFTIRLPSVVERASGRSVSELASLRWKALLVDDEPQVLALMVRALKRLGWEVEAFSSAQEALQALGAGPFDLIISDFSMPGMDGEEFFRKAVALRPDVGRRFIFVTARALSEKARPVARAYSLPVLLKPFDLDELDRAVAHIAALRVEAPGGGAP